MPASDPRSAEARRAAARPAVWVGHVTLPTPDVPATRDFFLAMGMRLVEEGDGIAILELRGGTHLLLLKGAKAEGAPAYFDLMVDDLRETHRDCTSRGLAPSDIESETFHERFQLVSPSGHVVTVNSSHVSDLPV